MPNRCAFLLMAACFFLPSLLSAQNNTLTISGPTVVCLNECYNYQLVGQNPGGPPLNASWSVTDPSGVTTTNTDANGILTFCFTMPGTYKIQVLTVSGNGSATDMAMLTVLSAITHH
ncbi:MAG: hypothetical protein IPL65_00180 [Lewinellaceae bacterium]|nr:hypothetical protein [Lewinellaceae bacterium]